MRFVCVHKCSDPRHRLLLWDDVVENAAVVHAGEYSQSTQGTGVPNKVQKSFPRLVSDFVDVATAAP